MTSIGELVSCVHRMCAFSRAEDLVIVMAPSLARYIFASCGRYGSPEETPTPMLNEARVCGIRTLIRDDAPPDSCYVVDRRYTSIPL